MKQIVATYTQGKFDITIFSVNLEDEPQYYQVVILYRHDKPVRYETDHQTIEEAKNYMVQNIMNYSF
jgi:hypothetical protein